MWNRRELKEKAKNAFMANYWKSVLVSFLLAIAAGGAGLLNLGNNAETTEPPHVPSYPLNMPQSELITLLLMGVGVLALIGVISIVLRLFLLNPLKVGCMSFFKENAEFPSELDEIGTGFRTNYGNVVLTMFVHDVLLGLWALVFLIPGVVKAYSYRMVPYIIAENPNMTPTDAITKSREMMRGHKLDAFVLDLSFLGWIILSGFTLGILAIFYVFPYMNQTDAELYLALKNTKGETE